MVVGARVGPADDHDGHVFVVDAVVVDRRLQEVRVGLEPFGQVEGGGEERAGGGGREGTPAEGEDE